MDFDAPPIIASTGRGHIGPLAGQLTMDGFRFKRHFSFLDYLRGGLELQLMVAVDLTRSNLGQTNPKSMATWHKRSDVFELLLVEHGGTATPLSQPRLKAMGIRKTERQRERLKHI